MTYCIMVACALMCKDIKPNEFGQEQLGEFYIKEIDEKCLAEQNK